MLKLLLFEEEKKKQINANALRIGSKSPKRNAEVLVGFTKITAELPRKSLPTSCLYKSH